ncbi:MAG: M48 family metalloprotease [Chitinophagales bacterium]
MKIFSSILSRKSEINIRSNAFFAISILLIIQVALRLSSSLYSIFFYEKWVLIGKPIDFFDALDNPNLVEHQIPNDFREEIIISTEKLEIAINHYGFFVVLGALMICFLAIFIIYRLYKNHPTKIIETQKLEIVPPEKLPILVKETIERLIVKPIQFFTNNKIFSQNAQVFGFAKNICVRLDRGLFVLAKKDPKLFKTVLLHELSHIINKDIRITYLTESIWMTCLKYVTFPYIVISAITMFFNYETNHEPFLSSILIYFQELLLQITPILFIVSMLFLSKVSVIKIREFYADLRCCSFGMLSHLKEIFKKAEAKRYRLSHPTNLQRLQIINAPHKIFNFKPFLFLIIGLFTGALFTSMDNLYKSISLPIESVNNLKKSAQANELLNKVLEKGIEAFSTNSNIPLFVIPPYLYHIIILIVCFLLAFFITRSLGFHLVNHFSVNSDNAKYSLIKKIFLVFIFLLGIELSFFMLSISSEVVNQLQRYQNNTFPVKAHLSYLFYALIAFLGYIQLIKASLSSSKITDKVRYRLFSFISVCYLVPILFVLFRWRTSLVYKRDFIPIFRIGDFKELGGIPLETINSLYYVLLPLLFLSLVLFRLAKFNQSETET